MSGIGETDKMLTMKEILEEFEESSNDIKFLKCNKKITDSIERPQEQKFILEHFSYVTVNGYLKILGNDSEVASATVMNCFQNVIILIIV